MKKVITLVALLLVLGLNAEARTVPAEFNKKGVSIRTEKSGKYEIGHRFDFGDAGMSRAKASELDDDDALMYAFRVFGYGDVMHGWYNYQAQNPENNKLIKDFGADHGMPAISAATYAKGQTIAYVYESWSGGAFQLPVGIAVLDETTGEYELKFKTDTMHLYNECIMEMAYDPKTDKVYGMQFVYDENGYTLQIMNLYEIDQTTYEPKLLGTIDCYLITMSAHNGYLYGITQDYSENTDGSWTPVKTRLVKIDLSKSEEGVYKNENVGDIGNGDRLAYYNQTMEFDHTTHRLWWAAQDYWSGYMVEIDIETGALSHENPIPETAQLVAMVIPYQTAPDAAPAQVREFKAATLGDATLQVDLTWKNPTWNYQREELSDIKGVKIYRDGELIEDIATDVIGGEMSWSDTSVEKGTHVYKLVAYNSAGDGLYKERELYVGEDTPGAVVGLNAEPQGASVTISWDAPASGKNSGWYDTSSLVYDVYRGSHKLATGITATEVTDEVSTFGHYTYRVTPKTNEGYGSSSSLDISFGPSFGLPYENDLSTAELGEEMSVLDANNDKQTWYYSEGSQAYTYIAHFENQADDYLVLPPVDVEKGKKYELRFEYFTSNYSMTTEDMEVVVGNGIKTDRLTTSIAKFEDIPGGSLGAIWYPAKASYIAEEDGQLNFGFRCYSAPMMGFISISNIYLREIDESEVSAEAISGSADAYIGEAAEYTVTVVNQGTGIASDVKVQLVDADDNVISETVVEEIPVGETAEVVLKWTPTEETVINIYGRVLVDGDNFEDDNQTLNYISVTSHPAEGYKFITIGVDNPEQWDNRVIDVNRAYSRMQSIFFSDEFEKDYSYTLCGLRLFYSASESASHLTEIPLTIKMLNTDKSQILDPLGGNDNGGFYNGDDMVTVFDGVIDISGTDPVYNYVHIDFDQEFEYISTGNLLIELNKELNESYSQVQWHTYINPEHSLRSGHYNYNVPYGSGETEAEQISNMWNTEDNHVPYIKFAYSKKTGVESVNDAFELNFRISDSSLVLTEECDKVEVYNVAGMKVASYDNVEMISLSELQNGLYIIRIVDEGKVIARKIMVK